MSRHSWHQPAGRITSTASSSSCIEAMARCRSIVSDGELSMGCGAPRCLPCICTSCSWGRPRWRRYPSSRNLSGTDRLLTWGGRRPRTKARDLRLRNVEYRDVEYRDDHRSAESHAERRRLSPTTPMATPSPGATHMGNICFAPDNVAGAVHHSLGDRRTEQESTRRR